MKNNGKTGDENADELDARHDAALWELLGRAPAPKASPYFARRVLREVGLHEEQTLSTHGARWWQPAALWRACRRLPRLAFAAGAPVAALLMLFLGLHMNHRSYMVVPHPRVGGNDDDCRRFHGPIAGRFWRRSGDSARV